MPYEIRLLIPFFISIAIIYLVGVPIIGGLLYLFGL
jgi:hypothetical protein